MPVGDQHVRQRKIMNPGFSYGALRGFLPLFRATAQRVGYIVNRGSHNFTELALDCWQIKGASLF